MLVCSTDIHVAMFVPVARELSRLGLEPVLVSLDAYYGQRATSAAAQRGASIIELDGPRLPSSGSFYQRPAPGIWLDTARARGRVAALLDERRPSVVVVGNDRGLIEKVILGRAHRLGATTVLVQDGHVGRRRTPEIQTRRRMWRWWRRSVSQILRLLGATAFAATDYGSWGCDLVCASGSEGAEALIARGVPEGRLIVTGQPRYDDVIALADRRARRGVVWFTTPFASQNLSEAAQQRQIDFVVEVAASLAAAGVQLTVKPHPREDAGRYDRAVMALSVSQATASPGDVLADASLAVIGMSSVTDEAVLAGVPVAVPGRRIHNLAFEPLLPDPTAFPRVECGEDVVALVEGLRTGRIDRGELLDRQRAVVQNRVSIDAEQPAATRVAVAIAGATR